MIGSSLRLFIAELRMCSVSCSPNIVSTPHLTCESRLTHLRDLSSGDDADQSRATNFSRDGLVDVPLGGDDVGRLQCRTAGRRRAHSPEISANLTSRCSSLIGKISRYLLINSTRYARNRPRIAPGIVELTFPMRAVSET